MTPISVMYMLKDKWQRINAWISKQAMPVRAEISKLAYQLADSVKLPEPEATERGHKLGEFIEIDQRLTFDKFDFEGPLMHVGSKINYEDAEAEAKAAKFRTFLREKLHGSKEVLGVDLFDGENVDIVADLCEKDLFVGDFHQHKGQFKTVLCWALLEHVQNPFVVASNIEKFLAPGGKVFFVGPWVWGYHPYPDDYWRISFSGLQTLFPNVEWHDWWYTGTNEKVGFRIKQLRNERKVFQVKSEITADIDTISDRYMPYLNVFAIGSKRA